MSTAQEAVDEAGILDADMDYRLADLICQNVAQGVARWIWDPDVDGVVGLEVLTDGRWVVKVVVWLEARDFEVSDGYEDAAYSDS